MRSREQIMLTLIAILIGCCHPALAQTQKNAAPVITCEQLGSIKLKDASSITSQSQAGGTFSPPGNGPGNAALNNLPAFCRVSLVVKPQINIEVWLPMSWNERFQAVGGGGYAGAI